MTEKKPPGSNDACLAIVRTLENKTTLNKHNTTQHKLEINLAPFFLPLLCTQSNTTDQRRQTNGMSLYFLPLFWRKGHVSPAAALWDEMQVYSACLPWGFAEYHTERILEDHGESQAKLLPLWLKADLRRIPPWKQSCGEGTGMHLRINTMCTAFISLSLSLSLSFWSSVSLNEKQHDRFSPW